MDAEKTLELLIKEGIVTKEQIESVGDRDPIWSQLAVVLHDLLCKKTHLAAGQTCLAEEACLFYGTAEEEEKTIREWEEKVRRLCGAIDETPESLHTFLSNAIETYKKIPVMEAVLIALLIMSDQGIIVKQSADVFSLIPEEPSDEQSFALDLLPD